MDAVAGAGQLVGLAAATLLTAAFLVAVKMGWRRRRRQREVAPEGGCRVVGGDGGDRTDIVIVGAGVAGSALAYTLGKVATFLSLTRLLTYSHLVEANRSNLFRLEFCFRNYY